MPSLLRTTLLVRLLIIISAYGISAAYHNTKLLFTLKISLFLSAAAIDARIFHESTQKDQVQLLYMYKELSLNRHLSKMDTTVMLVLTVSLLVIRTKLSLR